MEKQRLRAIGLAARNALSEGEREEKSRAICKIIMEDTAFQKADTILFYKAVRSEVSLEAAIQAARLAGKRCCFPKCGEGGRMDALLPLTDGAWRIGAYKIPEPDPEQARLILPEQIDLVLLPGPAFDAAGHRIGMGGGYYDRYLPLCPDAKRMLVAFSCQQVEDFMPDPWDVPMDTVVTERGLIQVKGRHS